MMNYATVLIGNSIDIHPISKNSSVLLCILFEFTFYKTIHMQLINTSAKPLFEFVFVFCLSNAPNDNNALSR